MKIFYILLSCPLVAASLWQLKRRETPGNYFKFGLALAVAAFAWTSSYVISLLVFVIVLALLCFWLGGVMISLYLYYFTRIFSSEGRKVWKELTPDERMDFAVEEFFTEERIPFEKIPEWRANRQKQEAEELARKEDKARREQEKRNEAAMLEAEKLEMLVVCDGKTRELVFSVNGQEKSVWPEAAPEPGEYAGKIRFEYPPDRRIDGPWDDDPVRCFFEWTDTVGGNHQTETWMRADMEFRLQSTDAGVEKFWWKDAKPEWQTNFRQHCVLAGVRIVDDMRKYFRIQIGSETFIIRTKYLGYLVDVALSADGRRFCVRIQDMHHQVWEGDPLSEDVETAEAAEMLGLERLKPFCFEIPVERILPVTVPHCHARQQADLYEGTFLGVVRRASGAEF